MFDPAAYWQAVAAQDRGALARFFTDDAVVRWHNTDERFTVDEFVRANCEYPGAWRGELKRAERFGDTVVTVVRVFSPDAPVSLHAVSLIRLSGEKIAEIDEYWSEDGEPPGWRKALNLGRPIRGRDASAATEQRPSRTKPAGLD